MSDADLDWLASVAEKRTYAERDVVIRAGQPIDALLILLEGEVEIVLPEGLRIDRACAGEILGEMSLIEQVTPTVVVHALAPVRAIAAPHAKLSARAESDPAFGARLFKALARILSQRLRAHGERMMFGFDDADRNDGKDAEQTLFRLVSRMDDVASD